MTIVTAQDIIDVIVDNNLQQYPIYCTTDSELVLNADEYLIVIHLDGIYNQRETATYQYPNNWRDLNDTQLNDSLRYYHSDDSYEPDESSIIQIYPIVSYSVIEVVPLRIYNIINDIFEENREMYKTYKY